jgi:2-polyprenyl-6-methoxyphenol hydroxylase-like FAD-dependent oxidoreductase
VSERAAGTGGLKAIVIGGGIGGVTTAYALNKQGMEAEVYEQADDLRKIYVGSGIHMWNNAMRALKEIGLAQAVEDATGPDAVVEHMQIVTHKGRVIADVPLGDIGRRIGGHCVGINRAELLPLLGSQLDDGVLRVNSKFLGFTDDGSGVTARFEDGHETRGDILIGADGVFSTVRHQLHGESKPRYAGYTIWQGIVPTFDHSDAPIGLFPIMYGPGLRFAFYRVGGARLYWFAVANAEEGGKDPDGSRKPMLAERFKGWPSPVEEIIAATDEPVIHRRDLYDRDPVKQWGEGRVTLLGDAAHAMTFDVGQGAGQSIEDALVLSRYLNEDGDPVAALRRYEQRRMPRTAHMQRLSRFIGTIGKWDKPSSMRLRGVITWMMFNNPIAYRKFQQDLTYKF